MTGRVTYDYMQNLGFNAGNISRALNPKWDAETETLP
jgi:hypothetical protein